MATGIANDYYLKARECYPWYLSEFLEAINYALSYDDNHADAHCLFGKFYMEQLSKFNEAIFHFEKALAADMDNIPTYYAYIRLSIQTENYQKARKLMKYASGIIGADKSYLMHLNALILEKEGKLKHARRKLDELLKGETCNRTRDYIKKELIRIKEKQNTRSDSKSEKHKKKGKKKKNAK